jgi:hypothetical protein
MHAVIEHIREPANFAWDPKQRRLIVPFVEANRVEIWQLQGEKAMRH